MLAKEYRLPGRTHFSHVLTRKTSYFLVRIQKNNLPVTRFGFVVSKKLDTRAVIRNRIKRVFRSYIEQELSYIVSGYDILFILSPAVNTAEFQQVKEALVKTLQETKLLSK